MMNHVTTRYVAIGPSDDLENFCSLVIAAEGGDAKIMDFDKIVPIDWNPLLSSTGRGSASITVRQLLENDDELPWLIFP
jgi:hypothetical protein